MPAPEADIQSLRAIGALRQRCSAPLACAAHDCPLPCEACEAEDETDAVCTACRHVFAAEPIESPNRVCFSEQEYLRTGHVAFYAEAKAASEMRRQQEEERRAATERLRAEQAADRARQAAEAADRRRKSETAERNRRNKPKSEERPSPPAAPPRSRGRSAWGFILVFVLIGLVANLATRNRQVQEKPPEAEPAAAPAEAAAQDRQIEPQAPQPSTDESGVGADQLQPQTSSATEPPLNEVGNAAWLGVQLSNLDDTAAQSRGLPGAMGALVEELVADSPAERSGLLKGDVLIGINGEFIDAVPDVLKELAQINPGSTVELRIMRDRQELRINVEAGVRPTP